MTVKTMTHNSSTVNKVVPDAIGTNSEAMTIRSGNITTIKSKLTNIHFKFVYLITGVGSMRHSSIKRVSIPGQIRRINRQQDSRTKLVEVIINISIHIDINDLGQDPDLAHDSSLFHTHAPELTTINVGELRLNRGSIVDRILLVLVALRHMRSSASKARATASIIQ